MAESGPPPHREKASPLAQELDRLLRQSGGQLAAAEICRRLFRAPQIPERLASRLLENLIGGDHRFLLKPDGSVHRVAVRPLPAASLSRLRYTVIDLETTGGSPSLNRIVEIGAFRVEKGRILDSFQTLLNPGVPIPSFITSITGIGPEMVEAAPTFETVAATLSHFIGDSVLVAHNLPFDLGFLNQELARACGFILTNPSLCTVRLARRLLPQLPDRRLDTLADYYGLAFGGRHRAVPDAEMTARLLLRFIALLEERGVRDLEAVGRYLSEGRVPGRNGFSGSKGTARPGRRPGPSAGS